MTYIPKAAQTCRQKRQCKGGGVMMWGMIFSSGTVYIKKMIGRQNSDSYKEIKLSYAVPHILNDLGSDFILQQDNCSIHVSQQMLKTFKDEGISILEWP